MGEQAVQHHNRGDGQHRHRHRAHPVQARSRQARLQLGRPGRGRRVPVGGKPDQGAHGVAGPGVEPATARQSRGHLGSTPHRAQPDAGAAQQHGLKVWTFRRGAPRDRAHDAAAPWAAASVSSVFVTQRFTDRALQPGSRLTRFPG